MQAWPNYQACASYDRKHWFRIHDTTYNKEKGILAWHHKPERVRNAPSVPVPHAECCILKIALYS